MCFLLECLLQCMCAKWWPGTQHAPEIPALRRRTLNSRESEASLDSIVRLCLKNSNKNPLKVTFSSPHSACLTSVHVPSGKLTTTPDEGAKIYWPPQGSALWQSGLCPLATAVSPGEHLSWCWAPNAGPHTGHAGRHAATELHPSPIYLKKF